MKENFITILNEQSGKNNPNDPTLQIFNNLPFPTKKTEEWIYTNPEMIFGNIKDVYSKSDDSAAVPLESPFQISFINGRLSLKNTTLPKGVNIAVYQKKKNYLMKQISFSGPLGTNQFTNFRLHCQRRII